MKKDAHLNNPERMNKSVCFFFFNLGEVQIFLQSPLLGPLGPCHPPQRNSPALFISWPLEEESPIALADSQSFISPKSDQKVQ